MSNLIHRFVAVSNIAVARGKCLTNHKFNFFHHRLIFRSVRPEVKTLELRILPMVVLILFGTTTVYHKAVNRSSKSNRINPCVELKTCTGENIVNTKVGAITKTCEHPTYARTQLRIHTVRIAGAVFGTEPSMIYRVGRNVSHSLHGYKGLLA
jgi:hypothetical protein